MSNAYLTYAAKRLVQSVVVILLAYVFTFVVVSILPGDPITNVLRDPQNGFTEAQWEVSCTGEASTCGYDWEWSPAQYLDDSLIPNPTLTNFGVDPVEFTV